MTLPEIRFGGNSLNHRALLLQEPLLWTDDYCDEVLTITEVNITRYKLLQIRLVIFIITCDSEVIIFHPQCLFVCLFICGCVCHDVCPDDLTMKD